MTLSEWVGVKLGGGGRGKGGLSSVHLAAHSHNYNDK